MAENAFLMLKGFTDAWGYSLTFIGRPLYADEDKGRDYGCSAEGANLAVNLSGKRTLIGRNSGERRPLCDGHQRGKPIT